MKTRIYNFDPYYFHVVGKCSDKKWPSESFMDVWELFVQALQELSLNHIKTHAFVLMSNHYHWLCSSSSRDIDLEWFHEALTFDFNHSVQMQEILGRGSVRPVFESKAEIMKLEHIVSLKNAYRYIYRNPIEAGLVKKAEYYPYSTLPYLLGHTNKTLAFVCHDIMHLIYDPKTVLEFINCKEKTFT
ncbi:MAG: hypothetical protein H6623_05460 [Bdellovibrionaceae bacterium]|nr:hypothetical protein [Pseudobdellovibrionaceae bacterium]